VAQVRSVTYVSGLDR